MVTHWGDVIGGAVATVLITLGLLQVPPLRRHLALLDTLWLALAGGAGVVIWNLILNLFSLAGLDIDAPVIRVSIADVMSGVMAGLLTWLYVQVIKPSTKSSLVSSSGLKASTIAPSKSSLGSWPWPYLLPALVAFVIDLFFI